MSKNELKRYFLTLVQMEAETQQRLLDTVNQSRSAIVIVNQAMMLTVDCICEEFKERSKEFPRRALAGMAKQYVMDVMGSKVSDFKALEKAFDITVTALVDRASSCPDWCKYMENPRDWISSG